MVLDCHFMYKCFSLAHEMLHTHAIIHRLLDSVTRARRVGENENRFFCLKLYLVKIDLYENILTVNRPSDGSAGAIVKSCWEDVFIICILLHIVRCSKIYRMGVDHHSCHLLSRIHLCTQTCGLPRPPRRATRLAT